jgi:hypothetical protein
MGVRQWFWTMLARGEERGRDPDELVEAGTVSFAFSEMTITVLRDRGIDAVAVGYRRVPAEGPLDRASIRVRAADLDAARRVLDEQE